MKVDFFLLFRSIENKCPALFFSQQVSSPINHFAGNDESRFIFTSKKDLKTNAQLASKSAHLTSPP